MENYSSISTKGNIVIKINGIKSDLLNNLPSHNHEPIGEDELKVRDRDIKLQLREGSHGSLYHK